MSRLALKTDAVTVKVKDKTILDAVSIELLQGEVLGLIGPNGSGKSTFLKLCAGIAKPTSGKVVLGDGKPLTKLSTNQRAQTVAYVPQNFELHSFSAYETVMMGRYNRTKSFAFSTDNDHTVVQSAMERTATTHLADRKFNVLSGGEQRRTIFARALAQDANIMVLDEPTADLDLKHRAALMQLVRQEVANGRTVIIALHDLELALRYCNRVYMLQNGVVYKQGNPTEVITPATVRTVFEVDITITPHPDDGLPHVSVVYSDTN